MVDSDAITLVDRIANLFFGKNEERKNNFRKCLAFEIKADRFLYIDADAVVLQPLNPIIASLQENLGFVFGNKSKKPLYNFIHSKK